MQRVGLALQSKRAVHNTDATSFKYSDIACTKLSRLCFRESAVCNSVPCPPPWLHYSRAAVTTVWSSSPVVFGRLEVLVPLLTWMRMHISGPELRHSGGGSNCDGKLWDVSLHAHALHASVST